MNARRSWQRERAALLIAGFENAAVAPAVERLRQIAEADTSGLAELLASAPGRLNLKPADQQRVAAASGRTRLASTPIIQLGRDWGLAPQTLVQRLYYWRARQNGPPLQMLNPNLVGWLRVRADLTLPRVAEVLAIDLDTLWAALLEYDRTRGFEPPTFLSVDQLREAMRWGHGAQLTLPEGSLRRAVSLISNSNDPLPLCRWLAEWAERRSWYRGLDQEANGAWTGLQRSYPMEKITMAHLQVAMAMSPLVAVSAPLDITVEQALEALVEDLEESRLFSDHGRLGHYVLREAGGVPPVPLQSLLDSADITVVQLCDRIINWRVRQILRRRALAGGKVGWRRILVSGGIPAVAAVEGITPWELQETMATWEEMEQNRRRAWYEPGWVAVAAAIGLIVLVVVILRFVYILSGSGFLLAPRLALVASHNLQAGEVLNEKDVRPASVGGGDRVVPANQDVTGVIVTNAIGQGVPLVRQNLQSLQVVAARDIAAGELVDEASALRKWTPYVLGGTTDLGNIIGKPAPESLRAGDPFVLTPLKTGSTGTTITAAVNRNPTLAVQTTVETAGPLRLLTIPLPEGVVDTALSSGSTVDLILVPTSTASATVAALGPARVRGASVRNVERRGDGAAIVVALSDRQIDAIAHYLGQSNVFVLQLEH